MKTWVRAMGFWLPPLVVCAWLSIPALQPAPLTLRGPLAPTEACLLKRVCGQVLKLGEASIGCRFDLLGAPYDCRRKLRELPAGTEAVAQVVALPSLARLGGLAPTAGVLTRLEVAGEVLHRRSVSQLVWQGLYGGWLFHAVYWPIVGLVIWRWPNSRLARRATWADATDEQKSETAAGSTQPPSGAAARVGNQGSLK